MKVISYFAACSAVSVFQNNRFNLSWILAFGCIDIKIFISHAHQLQTDKNICGIFNSRVSMQAFKGLQDTRYRDIFDCTALFESLHGNSVAVVFTVE